ncbi:MAG: hypothetical protein H6636_06930 [Anaerolineales bacterium]|nr:hypothetical protein [Anaerolineales bacterium]
MKQFFERLRSYPELKAGVVNLKSGTAFRGVVWKKKGGWLVLRGCEILAERGQPVQTRRVDGEVIVRMEDVDFVQVLS